VSLAHPRKLLVTQPTGAEQGRIRPGYIADPLVVAGDALTDVSTLGVPPRHNQILIGRTRHGAPSVCDIRRISVSLPTCPALRHRDR
jgi:hypothetical protein